MLKLTEGKKIIMKWKQHGNHSAFWVCVWHPKVSRINARGGGERWKSAVFAAYRKCDWLEWKRSSCWKRRVVPMYELISMDEILKVPLTPKIFFALLQNVSDLEMFKTKIKKIHKILTLLWTFKVAMFSFSTALWEVWVLANWWRRPGNRVFSSLVDLGVDFSHKNSTFPLFTY